jgi:hypothetical protein
MELSIFIQGDLWNTMNRGIFSDERVAVMAHPPSVRRSDRTYVSVLSEHRIVLGDEAPDLVADQSDDGDPRPMSDHKIGGRPYCIQEPELEGAEALLNRGLLQLLQLDFPDGRDATVSGSWPFADGLFNLFGAPPFDTFFWAFQK